MRTAANDFMAPIHDRMPAILGRDAFEPWLDCRSGSAAFATQMLKPAPDDLLEVLSVSRALNNPRNEGPEVQLSPDSNLN